MYLGFYSILVFIQSQEPLTNVAFIEKELQQRLTDVNDLLANLDIAVGFLVSITDDPNGNLLHFMTNNLKMKLRREIAETVSKTHDDFICHLSILFPQNIC